MSDLFNPPARPRPEPRVNLWQPRNGHDWKVAAACKDADVNLFFPVFEKDAGQAKAVCAGCSVVGECLAYGMSLPQDSGGVYGGLTETERVELRKKRRAGRERARRSVANEYRRGL